MKNILEIASNPRCFLLNQQAILRTGISIYIYYKCFRPGNFQSVQIGTQVFQVFLSKAVVFDSIKPYRYLESKIRNVIVSGTIFLSLLGASIGFSANHSPTPPYPQGTTIIAQVTENVFGKPAEKLTGISIIKVVELEF